MESWLDTSVIDLSRYRLRLLGETDEGAVAGLSARMEELIGFSAKRGKAMLPFANADDRAHMEPLAVECAAETARVAADVIHTLVVLTERGNDGRSASLTAEISAAAVDGMENLPAKLVVLGTDYSTLSEESLPAFKNYRGRFTLRGIPPGTYHLAIERLGSQTFFTAPVTLGAGEAFQGHWRLAPAHVEGNLAPNPDLKLHWLTPNAPDHWRFDAAHRQWLSDNIPVASGSAYNTGCVFLGQPASVELQWMAHAWEAMKTPPELLGESAMSVVAPKGALFARFVVNVPQEPATVLKEYFLKPDSIRAGQ